jgi:hypothetical protein
MKSLLTPLVHLGWLALSATACVAPSHVLQHLPSAVNSHQLPPLEPTVEMGALNSIDGTTPNDLLRLFQNEIYRNVAEPNGLPNTGTALLQITAAEVRRTGRALQMVQLTTMLLPSLLGVPLETYRTTLSARVQIRDGRGQLLAEYDGEGAASTRVAMYYGFGQHQAPGVSNALALRMALAQIRQKLGVDAPVLGRRLLAAQRAAAPSAASAGLLPTQNMTH